MKTEKMKMTSAARLAWWSFLPGPRLRTVTSGTFKCASPGDDSQPAFQATVSQASSSVPKFFVRFFNPFGQRVKVGLRAADGSHHLELYLFATSYSCLFDFTGVAAGWYTIEVTSGHATTTRKVLVSEKSGDDFEM